MEKMYIARTAAYFEPNEDDLYVPDLWTWSEDPDDKDFEGDVYELASTRTIEDRKKFGKALSNSLYFIKRRDYEKNVFGL